MKINLKKGDSVEIKNQGSHYFPEMCFSGIIKEVCQTAFDVQLTIQTTEGDRVFSSLAQKIIKHNNKKIK